MLFKVNRLDEITQKVRQGGGNILGLNLGPSWGMRERISKRRICQWNGKKKAVVYGLLEAIRRLFQKRKL